jgi:hypothetical protein
LYPILIRLCDQQLLEAVREADPPAGRPARHLYRRSAPVRFASEFDSVRDRATTVELRRRGQSKAAQ